MLFGMSSRRLDLCQREARLVLVEELHDRNSLINRIYHLPPALPFSIVEWRFSNTEHFDCKQEQRAVSTNATGYNEREVVGWGLH